MGCYYVNFIIKYVNSVVIFFFLKVVDYQFEGIKGVEMKQGLSSYEDGKMIFRDCCSEVSLFYVLVLGYIRFFFRGMNGKVYLVII